MASQTALIVGASRGLGLGLVSELLRRGCRVVGTVRGSARTDLHTLAEQSGGRLEIETIDINEPTQIEALQGRLAGRHFDLLFVNAGISRHPEQTIGQVTNDVFVDVMVTNALSPMRVVERLQSLVPDSGAIAVMSSGLGSVADNLDGGWEVYRASKASLNTLMRSFAARHSGDPRRFFIVSPGWVRTDMGGPSATLDVETSARGMVDVVMSGSGKPGLQYVDYQGKTIRW